MMKKRYIFDDGVSFEADIQELKNKLLENKLFLDNYLDVLSSLEDDDYVARGNGFCDRKYSEDFIDNQIQKYKNRISLLEKWISQCLINEN